MAGQTPHEHDDDVIDLTPADLARPARRHDDDEGIELSGPTDGEGDSVGSSVASASIRPIVQVREPRYQWRRPANKDGTGATHVKTFIAKLRADAMVSLDDQINQWLDEHPEYEVKFVTTAIGPLKGKETEDAMFVTVWV